MSQSRTELFVYYRVPLARWRDAARVVEQWQQRLQRLHPGLLARVLRRPEAADETLTLMEVYAFEDRSIDARLEDEIERSAAALEAWLIGPRHAERFETLD